VRISLKDIHESPREVSFEQPTADLNRLFERGPVHDFQFPATALGRLTCYRSGAELFFAGELAGSVVGECARCVEDFEFRLVVPFAAVFVPRPIGQAAGDEDDEDVDLYFYEGDDVDLNPLLHESILLALPTLALCQEGCRGLCPHCGINRNHGSCDCEANQGDPRFAALRNLKLKE
jgi:uncharacterized protein